MSLVWKLLRQHISIPQFTGFFFANLAGMLIIMLGIQFYSDTQAIYNSEDSFMKEDYLIVNKDVSILNTLGRSSAFTTEEMEDIEGQPFVSKMGAFTSSDYKVRARFDLSGFAFTTEMFFESVPDEFVDADLSQWAYSAGEETIPIIIPKNYLDLYNFGFAQSRGDLPELSEGILSDIPLTIDIDGNGFQDTFKGQIIGFSSRLNTILVPQAFMAWANDRYSPESERRSTRLILQVDNPTDERITSYLQDNNYQTDQDKLDSSKTTFLLRIVMAIVMSVGLMISILAFYILMLSVYLLVQKNSTKLENLLLIGYSPSLVSRPYQLLTLGLNVLVFILAVIAMLIVRNHYIALFESFFPDLVVPTILPSLLIGMALLLFISLLNTIAIRNKVISIWNRKD